MATFSDDCGAGRQREHRAAASAGTWSAALRTFHDVRADAKAMAKVLRIELERRGLTLAHGECLELVSRQLGAESWNHLAAHRGLPWQAANPTIPVLRIFAVSRRCSSTSSSSASRSTSAAPPVARTPAGTGR